MILFFLPYLAWKIYSLAIGIQDGAIFAHNQKDCNGRYPYNIHTFFVPSRGIVLGLCIGLLLLIEPSMRGFWEVVSQLIIYGLVFSFWHNGAYYETRKRLELVKENPNPEMPTPIQIYPKGWRSSSNSTTANFSSSLTGRTTMLISSLSFQIITYLIISS